MRERERESERECAKVFFKSDTNDSNRTIKEKKTALIYVSERQRRC